MSPERPSPPPPSRPGRSEPWRHERMVQRVPAHLGETTSDSVSPWLLIVGAALLIVVVCAVLFILFGSAMGLSTPAATATPTRVQRSATPIVTIIPVTSSPPTPTPGPTVAVVKYKVKSGDSLIEIAARYKVTVQAIRIANNLKDDTIRAGEELVIPLPTPTPPPGLNPPSASTPTPLTFQTPPSSAATPANTPGVIRYIVQRGDSLISIAAANGSTVDAIRVANQLDSDFLSIGQVLMLPVGAWTPTPTPAPVVTASTTVTPQFAYAPPSLMFPPDNTTFRGKPNAPTLEWVSPGTLKPNEFYVVHIEYQTSEDRKVLPSLTVKQGTSAKLDPAVYYPGANTNGWQFSWYVVVVSQPATPSARAPNASAPLSAVSPSSVTRTFVWY